MKELNGCTVTSVFYVLQDFTCQNMNFTDKSFFKFTLHCFFMFVESDDMNMYLFFLKVALDHTSNTSHHVVFQPLFYFIDPCAVLWPVHQIIVRLGKQAESQSLG